MQNNRKQRRILSLLILLLAITIGFALLSTTLKINGSAGIKSSQWDIHWDSNSISESGIEPTQGAEVTGEDDDTIEFSAELELPGDYYEFTIDAVNEGSIDGELKPIVTTILDSNEQETTLPEYIHYTVTYDDDTTPTPGDILEADDKQTYKIRIEFDREETTVPSSTLTYTIRTQIKYEQHKESVEEPTTPPQPTGPISITANKTTASVGETVTVTVSFTAAAWDLSVSGAASDEIVGYNANGENQLVTEQYTIDTSTAGVKTITITGNITDENEVLTDNISESLSITVQ